MYKAVILVLEKMESIVETFKSLHRQAFTHSFLTLLMFLPLMLLNQNSITWTSKTTIPYLLVPFWFQISLIAKLYILLHQFLPLMQNLIPYTYPISTFSRPLKNELQLFFDLI